MVSVSKMIINLFCRLNRTILSIIFEMYLYRCVHKNRFYNDLFDTGRLHFNPHNQNIIELFVKPFPLVKSDSQHLFDVGIGLTTIVIQ